MAPQANLTAAATRDAIRARETTAEETVALALGASDDAKSSLNAFLEIFHDRALEQAKAVDTRIASGEGETLPLAGVPIAIKDNICLAWGSTTCGSKMLEGYRSPYTATAAQRLINAGAIIVGKTNMDEFAMGSSGEHSAFGATRNPHDQARVTGGSSSGSAAAVGAGAVPIALGSDTGGSIRQPASHCGCVGLKPTYGRVSRYGLVAYASSLDQIGPLTRSVHDAALCLEVMGGVDPLDSTSSHHDVPSFTRDLDTPVENLRVGIPTQATNEANHPSVNEAMQRATRLLEASGAEIVTIDMPHTEHAIAAYYIVAPAEASSNLARFDGVRYGYRATGTDGPLSLEEMYVRSRTEGFGPEVRRRIMLGTHVLSSGYHDAYYLTALKVRRLIKQDYDNAFASGCHAILMPASPNPAFRLGEKLSDPMAMYLEDLYTVGLNLAGLPGITVPVGEVRPGQGSDASALPIGLQLIGAPWQESTLLRAARMLEIACAET